MFKSMSTSLIVRGVLAVIVGIIAIAWPSITVFALVELRHSGKNLQSIVPGAA